MIAATVHAAHSTSANTTIALVPRSSAFITSSTTPVAPMATGTPMPSTLAWTAIRSSTGSTWKTALIEPRVMPSLSAMSTIRADTTMENSASDDAPGPRAATSIAIVSTVTTAGLATRPRRSPNRNSSQPANTARNTRSTAFRTPVYSATNRVSSAASS